LRQAGDHGRCQFLTGRCSGYPLPACKPVVGVTGKVGEESQGKDVVHHLGVTFENGQQVLSDARLKGHLLQKPYITVEPIDIVPLISGSTLAALAGQLVGQAHIPAFREYQF